MHLLVYILFLNLNLKQRQSIPGLDSRHLPTPGFYPWPQSPPSCIWHHDSGPGEELLCGGEINHEPPLWLEMCTNLNLILAAFGYQFMTADQMRACLPSARFSFVAKIHRFWNGTALLIVGAKRDISMQVYSSRQDWVSFSIVMPQILTAAERKCFQCESIGTNLGELLLCVFLG